MILQVLVQLYVLQLHIVVMDIMTNGHPIVVYSRHKSRKLHFIIVLSDGSHLYQIALPRAIARG